MSEHLTTRIYTTLGFSKRCVKGKSLKTRTSTYFLPLNNHTVGICMCNSEGEVVKRFTVMIKTSSHIHENTQTLTFQVLSVT